jgi:hypothetical protein
VHLFLFKHYHTLKLHTHLCVVMLVVMWQTCAPPALRPAAAAAA